MSPARYYDFEQTRYNRTWFPSVKEFIGPSPLHAVQ